MPRIRHHLLLLLVLLGLVAVAVASPAAGQIDPGELSDLEQRRDEIVTQIAELDAQIAELQATVAGLSDDVAVASVEVELLADEFERTVDERREPARTRIQIAIAGFVGGDPRRSALIDEMEAVQGSDEPARRREMYGAVIDNALLRLADLDERLAGLTESMTEQQAALADTQTLLAETEQALLDTGASRSALTNELQGILDRIETLQDLANRAALTGLTSFDDPSRPALAVKIDNVREALPQAGINQADIVYVEEVEGGLTRLAAVFHSTGAEVVGPVRSMRTGDFDLLAQFNSPLFANSGGNRGARAELAASTLVDVGADSNSQGYYRDTERRRPHNLLTNAFNLWVIGAGRGNAPAPIFSYREPGTPAGPGARPASGVTIQYGNSVVTYDWNGSGWERSQDGQPTVDADGFRTTPITVVVHVTSYGVSAADAASPEAITIGSGPALVFTDGQVVEATWRRDSLGAQTDYIGADGNEVAILPGRTWVEMPRAGRTTVR